MLPDRTVAEFVAEFLKMPQDLLVLRQWEGELLTCFWAENKASTVGILNKIPVEENNHERS